MENGDVQEQAHLSKATFALWEEDDSAGDV